jgi:hypothetical protein
MRQQALELMEQMAQTDLLPLKDHTRWRRKKKLDTIGENLTINLRCLILTMTINPEYFDYYSLLFKWRGTRNGY